MTGFPTDEEIARLMPSEMIPLLTRADPGRLQRRILSGSAK